MKKRILSLLLALCATVSLLAVPAGAAPAAGFTDISDRNMAAAAECMRLLGAMDGYGPNTFGPDGQVTRAQFCKMAVYAMNGEGQLGRYRTVTVYPDVKPSHWAAPYINMASDSGRGSTGEDKTDRSIIKGYADGKFHPASPVSYGQAVTILMRMLGYSDADMGGIWPDGYLASADDVGLTDGVKAAPTAVLTRGQAALLFVNLLRSNVKGGGNYGASIAAGAKEGVMLASSTATANDGTDTAMQLGDGAVYSMANKPSTGALNGCKGTLLLNKDDKVLTFVPESASSSQTVTFAEGTSSKLTTSTGKSFAVSGVTKVNLNTGKESTWSEQFALLTPGTSLTLYLSAAGNVEYIFVGGSASSTAAVVVYNKGSAAGFTALTGGNTRYSIYKNGRAASTGDLRPYDVATYSTATNAIRVCDTRITGVYENASPNLSSPTKVTVLGHAFDVLATAGDTMSKLKIGQQITLLLTEDNKVAGAVPAGTGGASANAAGIASVSQNTATVKLLCGVEVSGSVSLTEAEAKRMEGQLVSVGSSRKGTLAVARLAGGVSGDLDVAAKRLGSKNLAENAAIYQSTSTGAQILNYSQITTARVPASGILYARTDWAGRIDLVIVSNITGSDYRFGRLSYTMGSSENALDKDDNVTTNTTRSTVQVLYAVPDGKGGVTKKAYGPYPAFFTIEGDGEVYDGDYVAFKETTAGTPAIDSLYVLTKYAGVANSAWSGAESVTIGGRSYAVPADVMCYNRATGSWVTLNDARSFGKSTTLYADKSGFIRAVEVNQ